jgi:hypothetical protein
MAFVAGQAERAKSRLPTTITRAIIRIHAVRLQSHAPFPRDIWSGHETSQEFEYSAAGIRSRFGIVPDHVASVGARESMESIVG